jgi:hypothetical protein
MAARSAHRKYRRARAAAAVLAGSVTAGVLVSGCRDATVPSGQDGPGEPEPRAGQYVVAEFGYHDSCREPAFGLTGERATSRSAMFDVSPESDQGGTIALTGTLQVVSPMAGAGDIVIFEGPDTGSYRVVSDTLRLRFSRDVNGWVGVLRFPRYQAGQLVGSSRTRCSSLSLRLEKRP